MMAMKKDADDAAGSDTGFERHPWPITFSLHPALRLVHCLQKERGASCALAGSRARLFAPNSSADCNKSPSEAKQNGHPYVRNVRSARLATNAAISSFYERLNFCGRSDSEGESGLGVASRLFGIRQYLDEFDEKSGEKGGNEEYSFFHKVVTEFSSLLSYIIQVHVIDKILARKESIETEIQASETTKKTVKFSSPQDEEGVNCSHPNIFNPKSETELSLLSLLMSFVALKESLGMERATLSGLMAIGTSYDIGGREQVGDDKLADSNEPGEESNMQTKSKEGSVMPRLPMIVNDLVVVVENQHRIMKELQLQTDGSIVSPLDSDRVSELDENYCSLLRLVNESIKLSEEMQVLQDNIREDFDVFGFQQAMTMEKFWSGITLYMDRLHSMELLLLGELDQCLGCFQDIDLLSLESRPSSVPLHNALRIAALSPGDASAQYSLNLLNGMTPDELKQTVSSFLSPRSLDNQHSSNQLDHHQNALTPSPSAPAQENDAKASLEEWEISLYDVEFHKRIGRGAAGTTYLGKWCGQNVAVKVASISQLGLDGWQTEIQSLKRLHHPNIIRFLGAIYNQSPLTYCLVLEYCNGGDLSEALAHDTPSNCFCVVSTGIASGLLYLHSKGILHRDIKPGNVLLQGEIGNGNFSAKLTDFGLAACLSNNASGDLTAETGTYRYMAPEVIRHERYEYSADIYSFALLMWQLITREKPFEPLSQIEAAGSVALDSARPPFPQSTPICLKELIASCWADNPNERMSIKNIICELDSLGEMPAEHQSWLQAPQGHPVYGALETDEVASLIPDREQKKRISTLKTLFRKKRMPLALR